MSEFIGELRGVGRRLKEDDLLHSAGVVLRAATRMAELEKLVITNNSELIVTIRGGCLESIERDGEEVPHTLIDWDNINNGGG